MFLKPFLIGIVSDVHAAPGPLREALSIFRRERVDMVLCPGDVTGYGTETARTVALLRDNNCTTILGNHDEWYLGMPEDEQDPEAAAFFSNLPRTWEAVIAGRRIHAVHASPPGSLTNGIALLDQEENSISEVEERWTGRLRQFGFDVLVVGHTHQVYSAQLGGTLVVNPGSSVFNNTCAILSLPDQKVGIFPLSGKKPRRTWHWGMMTSETS